MFIAACTPQAPVAKQTAGNLVAKAGNEVLQRDDYESNYNAGFQKDSTYYAKRQIENWAIESLLYQEALDKLDKSEMEIDMMVHNYRKSLVNFLYESKLVEANLDTSITAAEVEEYYKQHRTNFILKDNIVKVNYIKVPSGAPGLEKIRKLVRSGGDREQLIALCDQNAENFYLNDSTWLFLDEIKKEIPVLKEQPDFNLSPGRVIEFSDDSYYYYLKVKDVKVKNSLSPISFERDNIRKFVINARKTQLINEYKQLLLEKARESREFEIY
jgi:hypothetical protein